jgi:hypothetical protein
MELDEQLPLGTGRHDEAVVPRAHQLQPPPALGEQAASLV